eukprot:scaffold10836_cov98-Skeletonema_marinoi.AAC.3
MLIGRGFNSPHCTGQFKDLLTVPYIIFRGLHIDLIAAVDALSSAVKQAFSHSKIIPYAYVVATTIDTIKKSLSRDTDASILSWPTIMDASSGHLTTTLERRRYDQKELEP